MEIGDGTSDRSDALEADETENEMSGVEAAVGVDGAVLFAEAEVANDVK